MRRGSVERAQRVAQASRDAAQLQARDGRGRHERERVGVELLHGESEKKEEVGEALGLCPSHKVARRANARCTQAHMLVSARSLPSRFSHDGSHWMAQRERPAVPAPAAPQVVRSLRRPTDSLEGLQRRFPRQVSGSSTPRRARTPRSSYSVKKRTTRRMHAPAAAPVAAPIEGEEAREAATMPAEDEEAITTLAPVDEGEPAPAEAEAGGEAVRRGRCRRRASAPAEAEAGGEPAPAEAEAGEARQRWPRTLAEVEALPRTRLEARQ